MNHSLKASLAATVAAVTLHAMPAKAEPTEQGNAWVNKAAGTITTGGATTANQDTPALYHVLNCKNGTLTTLTSTRDGKPSTIDLTLGNASRTDAYKQECANAKLSTTPPTQADILHVNKAAGTLTTGGATKDRFTAPALYQVFDCKYGTLTSITAARENAPSTIDLTLGDPKRSEAYKNLCQNNGIKPGFGTR